MRYTLNDNNYKASGPGNLCKRFAFNEHMNDAIWEDSYKPGSEVNLFLQRIGNVKRRSGYLLCFIGMVLLFTMQAYAQVNDYKPVRTPQNVTVNRTLPKNVLAPNQAIPVKFSKEPTDQEIYGVHFFEEPVVPASGAYGAEENIALMHALAAFSQRKSPDDFSMINGFLKAYPQSRWRGALLANLGIVYRHTGYFNEAMDVWEQAWEILKKQTDRKAKLLADRVVSELLLANAWVGRSENIELLLKEIGQRVVEGPAGERVTSIREALWTMKNKPGISFKCGPYALNKIYTAKDSTKASNEKLVEVQSTAQGFSLTELESLAGDAGMKYQMAFRKPGAEIIMNAVVHWKLNHYSALLKKESGYYKCEDATMGTVYGQQFWLTATALDSSASGYFLVPKGPLPQGWRPVMPDEGSKIFGKGVEPPDKGKHVSDDDIQCGDCFEGAPMAKSNVHAAAVSLHVFDRPLYYSPPVGPAVYADVDYHQRDSYQPANFSYSNMGPKWTFEWLSYIQDDPNNPSANADAYIMGGGARTFTLFNAATQSYAPEIQTNDVLVRVCPTCYELRHPDGSKEVYARPDGSTSNGRKIFLTQKLDPQGNAVTVLYDAGLRITALKDAIGQVTTLKYEHSGDSYKITKVTDPFGRSASFNYDASGRLIKITDMIGIVSSFQYDGSDFIRQMTTPYGHTRYAKEDGPGNFRSLETSYPLGEKDRVEVAENAPGINASETIYPAGMNLFNLWLTHRNTFYWDKKAMKEAPGDYTKARIYHWNHGASATGESGSISPMLESIKEPLENRVWFNYQAQVKGGYANQGMSSAPSLTGRILDDGTTQLSRSYYNALGADTAWIDPVGRSFTYKYDTNKIDLLEVRQTKNGANEKLVTLTYNSQHLPLTVKDASGQVTNFTYNAAGQLLTVKNPKKETTTLTYNANGYLQNIAGAVPGAVTNFTYDGFGRLRTVTDQEGYTVTTDYDVLDRPTLITYPDSTFEQLVYDKLDAVHMKDRMGRWSHTIYDSLQQPNVIQDALGRITQLIWCSCGSLSEIVDPLKQVTTFSRDLQGRVTAKRYHDGKGMEYKYENTTSRLKEVTDAKGQKTQYSYFIDDNLKQVSYNNALIATPSVALTYDSIYDRVVAMADGTGTTAYGYKPVGSGLGSGQLSTVDGPLSNDVIAYNYDSLGRVSARTINGVASSVVFDALGRVTGASNVLGNFTYAYINQTDRLSSISRLNGESTVLDYVDNFGDKRLKKILNKTRSGTTISKFDYEYNKAGQITKWTQQKGTTTPGVYEFGYDLADQLTSATQKNQSTSAIVKRYAYRYDKSGNRTSEQIDNNVISAAYNPLNQLTAQQDGGQMRFSGAVSKLSSVMVKNQASADSANAPVDTTNAFEAFVKVIPGTNNVSITATDYSGNNNRTTNNYNITVGQGTNNIASYDFNGNTVSTTTPAVTYGWDAADRMVTIRKGNNITEFLYDGLHRRVAEKLNGTVIKRWIWDETELCEERDASGSLVTKRFFPQGEQLNGSGFYFMRDHLGSIREMTDASGAIKAQYDYDPYGRRTKVAGNMEADFGFTGHYFHASSGLHLPLYRAYDANTGRWLSRDPLQNANQLPKEQLIAAEISEPELFSVLISNSYSYVHNNPITLSDPFGLFDKKDIGTALVSVGTGIAIVGTGVGLVVTAPVWVAPALIVTGGTLIVAGGVTQAVGAFETKPSIKSKPYHSKPSKKASKKKVLKCPPKRQLRSRHNTNSGGRGRIITNENNGSNNIIINGSNNNVSINDK